MDKRKKRNLKKKGKKVLVKDLKRYGAAKKDLVCGKVKQNVEKENRQVYCCLMCVWSNLT